MRRKKTFRIWSKDSNPRSLDHETGAVVDLRDNMHRWF